MSIIDPTKNTRLIVDDFINYAQSHLTSVSGIINVTAIYPPGPPPAPGVVNWTGYRVEGPLPSQEAGTAEDQDTPETDDTPPVEGKELQEHEERNDEITLPGAQEPAESQIINEEVEVTFTYVNTDYNISENPGDFPTKQTTPRPRFKPKQYVVKETAGHNDTNFGNTPPLGPAPKIYGKVGATAYPGGPDFRQKYKNAFIPMEAMVGIEKGAKSRYTYKGSGGWYLLHPEAASQYFKMKEQAIRDKIGWTITSAYRDLAHQQSLGSGSTIAKAGSSPHGWGGAIDFGELYREVGGSGNGAINRAARETSKLYRWLSNNGPKYGWYNPYRLCDGSGTDENWHWEYWGNYVTYKPEGK